MSDRPNFSGVWRVLIDQSRFSGPAPASMLVRIEQADPQITQDVLAIGADGAERRVVFRFTTDGTAVENALGAASVMVRAVWIGDELEIVTAVGAAATGAIYRDYWSLVDGRLRMEHRDDPLAGQIVLLGRSPGDAAAFG